VLLEEAGVLQPFIRHFKADDATWDRPVIVALAEFSDTTAALALEVGADEFLLPPFEPREVLARVVPWSSACNMTGASSWPPTRSSPRIFQETAHPLFFCDRWGTACKSQPCLAAPPGLSGQTRDSGARTCGGITLCRRDRERFRRVITQPGAGDRVKCTWKLTLLGGVLQGQVVDQHRHRLAFRFTGAASPYIPRARLGDDPPEALPILGAHR